MGIMNKYLILLMAVGNVCEKASETIPSIWPQKKCTSILTCCKFWWTENAPLRTADAILKSFARCCAILWTVTDSHKHGYNSHEIYQFATEMRVILRYLHRDPPTDKEGVSVLLRKLSLVVISLNLGDNRITKYCGLLPFSLMQVTLRCDHVRESWFCLAGHWIFSWYLRSMQPPAHNISITTEDRLFEIFEMTGEIDS
jgi:hypothetical protein